VELLHKEITDKIIAACFQVSNELGAGFLEAVYQNALIIVLREQGLQVESEFPLSVSFHGQKIGSYFADLYVESKVIIELKAISALTDVNKAQLINYLKATGTDVGLLVNFGNPRLEYRRFDNRSKREPV
jgi:GxxExxY protein